MKRLLLITILSVISCNRPSSPTKESPTPTVLDPEMRGIYPHSTEFKKDHGKVSMAHRVQCLTCHGADGSGGTSKVACTSCHSYPHPGGWAMPSVHGEKFLNAKDTKKDCLNCHFRAENLKAISCKNCHEAYPHDFPEDEGFKSGVHGPLAKTYAGKCLLCHAEFKKHMSGDGCAACHSGKFKEIEFPLEASAAHKFKNRLERIPGSR